MKVVVLVMVVVTGLATLVAAVHPKCQPSPCANAGTCYFDKTINDTSCLCPAGFTGHYCYDIDLCPPGSCLNGGTCTPRPLSMDHTCVCQPGFTGADCGTKVSWCSGKPCQHGQCLDLGTTYTCDCWPGYTGTKCDVKTSLCSSSPCNTYDKQATCLADDAGYTCRCSDHQHFGLNCEADPQGCDHQEESYCICSVDNLPVKFPFPTPSPYDGADTRDVIAGITGILIGWLVGSAIFGLYHCCCTDGYGGMCWNNPDWRRKKQKPWDRPSTSNSYQTSSTGYTRSTRPGSVTQIHPRILPSTGHPENPKTTNIYRAGFMDDMSHMVSSRKSPSTYASGSRDW